MNVIKPEFVELSENEKLLFDNISFDNCDKESCIAASELVVLLLNRNAIPKIRLRYFTEPELNIGRTKKSRKEIFEGNGTVGLDAIFKHPHFLKYLEYFIFGPKLPVHTINGFVQIIEDDLGTSGDLLDQMRKYVRAETRNLPSVRLNDIKEEFFKLALECGLDLFTARCVRDAAGSVR